MLEEDIGDIVPLQAQTSPYFQLREEFKCMEHMTKVKPNLKLLSETRESEQSVSQFQITSLNPEWMPKSEVLITGPTLGPIQEAYISLVKSTFTEIS